MKLFLIRGLPGSGKSTFAKKLDAVHYEADMFHMKNGVYVFDSKNAGNAHSWCLKSACDSLASCCDVVVSNTFTRINEMRPYFDFCLSHGIAVEVKNMNGDYGSIHNVPQRTLDDMRNRWEWFPDCIIAESSLKN